MDVGVVVQNVGTAVAVHQAVVGGRPLIERAITVGGSAIATPQNLYVRIGTTFRDVLAFCSAVEEDVRRLVMGGPMMGVAQSTLDVPVVKATSGILAWREAGTAVAAAPCIKCGRCVERCPVGLVPCSLCDLVKAGRIEEAVGIGLADCTECGCCVFGCQARIPLTQYFKWGKAEWAAKRKRG